MNETPNTTPSNFIHDIIDEHNTQGRFDGRVHTRFPPEPNGYLHIGHAKSICLNFGTAAKYGGLCNLRFDDTNPSKEEVEYVESIQEDVKWLGFSWDDRMYYASDYFEKLFGYAVDLIKMGKAYVCDLSADQIREYRGTLKEPGKESPYRNRSIEENLDLFMRMRKGEFADGSKVLRAKIDMASPNISMRDPAMYRIKREHHHRTGDQWCIYPMYDFAHCFSDSIEHITHSICTLEFENNRPLYDWFLDQVKVYHPQQIEFARLSMTHTLLSKRKLLELVEQKYVSGWDDPRMPTIAGLRRRGYTPEAIRTFCERIGVAKANSTVDLGLLEYCIREDLNKRALRVSAILNPLKIVIDNYPEGEEELDFQINPEVPETGTRKIKFSKEIYIEREDFMLEPPKNFYRLSPGREVRLMNAYYVTCKDVLKDANGEVTEVHCTYDPESRGGWTKDGRKVKGTLHWISAARAIDIEVRLYENLFSKPNPSEEKNYKDALNSESLKVVKNCKADPILKEAKKEDRYQFIRLGYFCPDLKDFSSAHPVFNRTIGLRDTWAKIQKKD